MINHYVIVYNYVMVNIFKVKLVNCCCKYEVRTAIF